MAHAAARQHGKMVSNRFVDELEHGKKSVTTAVTESASFSEADRYHRPIDSSLRFWLNSLQVSESSESGLIAAQPGDADRDLKKTLGDNFPRVIREVMGR